MQYGGQTPLKLARELEAAGAPIIGTTPDSIDLAEDRERFQKLVESVDLKQPPNSTARNKKEALDRSSAVGYPSTPASGRRTAASSRRGRPGKSRR